MFKVALLAVLTTVVTAKLFEQCDELFEGFKKKYKVSYGSDDEESSRHDVFCANMKLADQYNIENGSPAFGVTKFADRRQHEFQTNLGRKGHGKASKEGLGNVAVRDPTAGPEKYGNLKGKHKTFTGTTPSSVDWTAEGVVTPVKNQGQCGACWAFSVAETVESQWAMNGNSIWEFSPQQVTSCTPKTFGCGGGDTVYGYDYIMSLPTGEGLGSAAFCPFVESMYTACTDKRCTKACETINTTALTQYESLTGPYATVTDYQYATPPCTDACATQNLTLLAANVATYGPASICVDASRWNLYAGGVMTASGCGGAGSYSAIDHCVQLTGYNTDADTPYWIVRNSWATNWGVDGFIYLEFDANTCGLADEATFVTIGNNQ